MARSSTGKMRGIAKTERVLDGKRAIDVRPDEVLALFENSIHSKSSLKPIPALNGVVTTRPCGGAVTNPERTGTLQSCFNPAFSLCRHSAHFFFRKGDEILILLSPGLTPGYGSGLCLPQLIRFLYAL
jgi:hypothetical protein